MTQAPPSPPQEPNTIKPVILGAESISSHSLSSFPDPSHGKDLTWRTLLSTPQTPTSSLCAGIATCPPSGFLARHRHKEAEIYYIISGKGVMEIDGKQIELEKGGVVFIPSDAEHGVWNTSVPGTEGEDDEGRKGKDLVWLYVFPTGSFGDVVYRFSEGKGENVDAENGDKLGAVSSGLYREGTFS
ncbi:RmlC-like cupin domain-containing protein [Aspergillus filifer]